MKIDFQIFFPGPFRLPAVEEATSTQGQLVLLRIRALLNSEQNVKGTVFTTKSFFTKSYFCISQKKANGEDFDDSLSRVALLLRGYFYGFCEAMPKEGFGSFSPIVFN
jgi:hypothetical protein